MADTVICQDAMQICVGLQQGAAVWQRPRKEMCVLSEAYILLIDSQHRDMGTMAHEPAVRIRQTGGNLPEADNTMADRSWALPRTLAHRLMTSAR
jgi:hypothetical protein